MDNPIPEFGRLIAWHGEVGSLIIDVDKMTDTLGLWETTMIQMSFHSGDYWVRVWCNWLLGTNPNLNAPKLKL